MNALPNEWPRLFPARPNHIDTLQVRPGYFIPIDPLQVIHLGGGYWQRQVELMLDDDARMAQ